MKPIRSAYHATTCLLLISAILFRPHQSLARTADPVDSTFKDWYYTPTGVFGRVPLTDPTLFGLIKTEAYFTDTNVPAISRTTGCYKLVKEYDKDANPVDISAYGPNDQLIADRWGAFRARMKYDHDDNLTETDYFDLKGSLTNTTFGYAQAVKEYRKGFVVKETFYNSDSHIISSTPLAGSVAIIDHRYDQYGNETERDYYDPEGTDIDNAEGVHKILSEYSAEGILMRTVDISILLSSAPKGTKVGWRRFARDEKGRMIAMSYITDNGVKLTNMVEGANIIKYRYDNWGRVVSTSFWENDSLKTLGVEGYHESVTHYNEDGQVIELDNYDEQGKPSRSFTGYSRQIIHYNDQGLVAERDYNNGDSAVLMEDKNAYSSHFHSARYTYDEYNQVRRLDYYDCAGRPINASLWFPDNKRLAGQRLEFKYAGWRLVEEDFHDLGDIAAPMVIDGITGKFVPSSGVARIPSKYYQRRQNKPAATYHGSIQPGSPLYDDQMAFVGHDSILIFLNSNASKLIGMACAELYRLVRVNKFYQLDGVATDYYIDTDSVAERLTYDAGDLSGPCIFYYPNGQTEEMGLYTKNVRTGRWEYFYDNGQKAKTILFADPGPRLLECYSRDGQVLAEKGNGRFEGVVLTNTLSSPIEYTLKGPVKDGLPDGEWKAYNKFIEGPANIELFSAGNFKSGTSFSLAGKTKYDKNFFSRFESLHAYEKLDYYGQTVNCANSGPISFSTDEFAGLKQGVKNILNTGQYKDYTGWVFLDLLIGTSGSIDQKVIRLSQQNDAFEKDIRDMLDHVQFKPWNRKGQDTPYEKFYIVLVSAGNFVIPEELLINQRRIFR